ncbi:SCO family protein [Vibrio sinensis]|uniref:SCO family protein n=1 Tax=Vibrio sinensis TaxID=2302434 RepID=A0A3A6QGV3_9VIBR|nr:SCO family protein [Vibrio sinensis]RJX69755.1 SCO family protein [Vibrio sinensis]
MNTKWIFTLAIAFGLGFAVNTYLDRSSSTDSSQSVVGALKGKDNQQVNLYDPEDPRIRVVYFGFTRCPDVCPTSLAMLAGALNQLNESDKSKLRPIFISLDPERDAATDSHQYAQYFHPMIEGLSAPLEVTQPLAHRYGVIFRKTELENSELKYTLDHSSYFYFLQPDGTLITKVPHTLSPAPLVEAIQSLNKGILNEN